MQKYLHFLFSLCLCVLGESAAQTVAPIHTHQHHLAKLALALSQTFSCEKAGSDCCKRCLKLQKKNEEEAAVSLAAATEISIDSAAVNKTRPLQKEHTFEPKPRWFTER